MQLALRCSSFLDSAAKLASQLVVNPAHLKMSIHISATAQSFIII